MAPAMTTPRPLSHLERRLLVPFVRPAKALQQCGYPIFCKASNAFDRDLGMVWPCPRALRRYR
jgi:hypothetical protein